METVQRFGINEACAWSETVTAGNFVFLGFCAGAAGESFEHQVHGALDEMERRLKTLNLTLDSVVKVDVLLRDAWNIPVMENVFRQRFNGKYPARKTIETNFAHIGGADGLHIQIDAVAYRT